MAPTTVVGVALSALLLTACDYSQKKPETGSLAGAPAVEAQARPAAANGVGERSIRLFGRGVSRHRQVRV